MNDRQNSTSITFLAIYQPLKITLSTLGHKQQNDNHKRNQHLLPHKKTTETPLAKEL